MIVSTPSRQLLRAKDLADAHYADPVGVEDMARAASLSRSHFIKRFREEFGVTPHAYLLTRRLERAATLLRNTDQSVAWICLSVGLKSVGSFTTSFKRTYGITPVAYRNKYPPAAVSAHIPGCTVMAFGRPQLRTFREDSPANRT